MATSYASLLNDLMPSLPGADTEVVLHELKRAAQDFFTRTRVWQTILEPTTVSAGDSSYEAMPDSSGTELVRIENAWISGALVSVVPAATLDMILHDWTVETGAPTFVTQLTPNVVRLFPIPSADIEVTLRVSLRPSDKATGVDSSVFAPFIDTILAGAKSRLYFMPKKPWTNPQLGQMFSMQYEKDVASETYRAALSFSRGHIRSKASFL